MKLSVVIPVYGCASCLIPLVERIEKSCRKIGKTEVILVDDGSRDSAWEILKDLCRKNSAVKAVKLSRNFGQHRAITAGIDLAKGDLITVMDCDLQDRPEEIPNLYRKLREGYDIVYARRTGRSDSTFRMVVSGIFHRIFGLLSGMETDPTVGNFSIAKGSVIDEVKKLKEQNRSYLQALKWVGFRHTYLDVKHDRRYRGQTAYTPGKLISYALDSITAHSDKPLKMAVGIGFFLAVFSFVLGLGVFLRALFWGIPITGWASLFVSLYFLAGLFFMYLGIIGMYLGKLFDESRKRPIYIISETLGVARKEL